MTEVELFTPRRYQLEGAEFLLHAKRGILADEMGLGKTGEVALTWKATNCIGPALLLARANAQATWIMNAQNWGIQTPYIVSGTKKQRAEEWSQVDKLSFMATTIESFKLDIRDKIAPRKWAFVIVEEAHRYTNRKTTLFKALKEIECEYIIFVTGSPLRRGFADLWALLNICNRKQFPSYWRYLSTFGYMIQNEFGAWEVLGLKEKDALQQVIAPYYIRRVKADVAPELPPKTKVFDHRLTLTKHQQKLYEELRDEMVAELSDKSLLVAPTVLAKITRLRQILCTPRLLDPESDWGAGLEHLGDLMDDTEDHYFVVFTPFAKAIPIIRHYLQFHKKKGNDVFHLQGGLKADEVNEKIDDFRKSKGVMICTISYAESFDLTPACWAYFLGFSWSITENVQAEDRLHRLTTTMPVTYYYPSHRGCIDEELVLEALGVKATEVLKVYNKSAEGLKRLLRGPQP